MSSADLEYVLANRREENIHDLVSGYLRIEQLAHFGASLNGIDLLGGLISALCLEYFNFKGPSHIVVYSSPKRIRCLYVHEPQIFNSDVYYCKAERHILYYCRTEEGHLVKTVKNSWNIAYGVNLEYANPNSKLYGNRIMHTRDGF